MKFLLDGGITPRLGHMLELAGHSFRYLPDYYARTSTDAQILGFALENEEVYPAESGLQISRDFSHRMTLYRSIKKYISE